MSNRLQGSRKKPQVFISIFQDQGASHESRITRSQSGTLSTGPGSVDVARTVALKAEELGGAALWVADHVVLPVHIKSRYPYNDTGEFPADPADGFLEPLPLLGHLAGATKRVRLGTWVLVLPHRNPIVAAKMCAALDVLSRGRMMLGAGIGWMEEESGLLGAPFKKRGSPSDEYLRAMRALWTNPDPQFDGEPCQFGDIKCEPQPARNPLPVWIGGHSVRAMRRVVGYGDGCGLRWPEATAASIEGVEMIRAAADKAGRDMSGIQILIVPAATTPVDTFIEETERYQDLGYDSFLAPLPPWSDKLEEGGGFMEDFAQKVSLES